MLKKYYSAVLNINFEDFEDLDEKEMASGNQITEANRLKILKHVYLNLLLTLGPKVTSVFTNFTLVNEELISNFYNDTIEKMEEEYSRNANDSLIYDFFTVATGEFTEINIGLSAKGVYIATVSSRKCVEQEVVSNYIEKNFLTIFLNETARDMIRYDALFGLQSDEVKKLFMYATILSLKNDVYPIPFSPLSKFVKDDSSKELAENKIRRIFRTLVENFGE